jgi:type I restriction enzyme S subunit
MVMKCFEVEFSELATSESIRLSPPFILPTTNYKYDKISNYLAVCESGRRPKGGISNDDDGEAISVGGEQINVDGSIDFSKIPYVSHEFYRNAKKGKVENLDILICKDGALTGKTCLINFDDLPKKEVMVNEHVYVLRGNNEINQKFLFYLTRSDLFQHQIKDLAYRKKAQPGLNSDHFKKVKIPAIPKAIQDQIVAKIEPIEQKIKDLKNQIKKPQEVINKVFAREFGFDYNLYNEFGKGMTAGTQIANDKTLQVFDIDFAGLARSGILRFSTRYHNPPTRKLMDVLDGIGTVKVKDIAGSYEKGVQPNYNPDGEISIVKITNLKNGFIDLRESEKITNEEFKKLKVEKRLRKNDIVICATGKVSLGKIDLFDLEEEAITSVDNYIIRLGKNYNCLFFVYFFRSILGYFQIERDYTGATNQIHLYWDQISNFLIPNLPLTHQQKIVDEIKLELDKQEQIKKQIEAERQKIDVIIEQSISS